VAVLIRIRKHKAILRSGLWRSADRATEELLNSVTEAWIQQTGGPPLHDSDPERTVAQQIAPRVGGRVLLSTPASETVAKRVYLSRRQLAFAFEPSKRRK
jgi:hypothetical protein